MVRILHYTIISSSSLLLTNSSWNCFIIVILWFCACLLSLLSLYVLSCTHLATIAHLSRTFQTFTMSFTIKLLPLLTYLECFCACLLNLLSPYVLSRTHLATISHVSNFQYEFYNQIATPSKLFRVILSMFISPYVLSRTHLARFKLSLWVSQSNCYPI